MTTQAGTDGGRHMNTYSTSEVARRIGIHPNTVRLYEAWGLIPRAERRANGYRVFTDFHLAQLQLVRVAFRTEVLRNGLRRRIVEAVKASAAGDFDRALRLTGAYRQQVEDERENAAEAIRIARRICDGGAGESPAGQEPQTLGRRQVCEALGLSVDTLRSWERNGLLPVRWAPDGCRCYTDGDVDRLMMIRALRCAGYSLEAILRLLRTLERDPQADMERALNTPEECAEIISVCDRLLVSLREAGENAGEMTGLLTGMRTKFANPPR